MTVAVKKLAGVTKLLKHKTLPPVVGMEVVVPKVQTTCFGLIGTCQCSAALGGPATSNN